MKITFDTKQHARKYQEDRFFIREFSNGETLIGVFDGHGGSEVSEYANKYAPYIFRALRKFMHPYKNCQLDLLKKFIERLNKKTIKFRAGSTASIVWIPKNKKFAYVAILGDSPVIINTQLNNIWIGPEHNVRSNPSETNHATTNYPGIIVNGFLYDEAFLRGYGLQMSRALGDSDLNRVLNRKPEVFKLPLDENSWILCGSDGLLDPGHTNTQEAAEDLSKLIAFPSILASDLIDVAIQSGSSDNITAILIRL